jgi:hypothetical protein
MSRRFWAAAATGLLLVLAFNLPAGLTELGRAWAWALPLELLLVAGLVLLSPARLRPWIEWLAATALALLLTVRLADWLLWQVLGRPVVLVQDLPLSRSLIELGRGSLGLSGAALAVLVVLLPPLAYLLLARFFLGSVARLPARRVVGAAILLVALAGELARPLAGGRAWPIWPFGRHGLEMAAEQIDRTRSALKAGAVWTAAERHDPVAAIEPDERLTKLRGIDVLIVFVESYGRSALEEEPFATPLRHRLDGIETRLEAHGLAAATGWITSPTVGGQSWLAHSTLASGVRTADQGGYNAYLQHADGDLAHLFAAAGDDTALISPAIVHPFPEAAGFGFERLLFADRLGYRGPRMGWVAMPDQYTLAVTGRLLWASRPAAGPGRFITTVLVGSHAPFTPLLPLVPDWDRLGDGSVFAGLPMTGEPPAAVWADHARLQAAYTAAIDLSLASLGDWLERFVDARTLVVMLGDHEPAALVTGRPDARDVPMHVVSGDPRLLGPFLKWGFDPGLMPHPGAAARPMASFRSFLVQAFSGPAAPIVAAGSGKPHAGQ